MGHRVTKLGRRLFAEVQCLFGDCEFVVDGPALWKPHRAIRNKSAVHVWPQHLVEDSMAVWTKRNSVDLSIATMNGFPLFLVDDVNRVGQRVSGTTHHARKMLA